MSTYADLITDVEAYVSSFGSQRDQVTSLTMPISSTDLAFTVDDAGQVTRGFLEVDDEIIAVQRIDTQTNTVYAHPWGRGNRGTTATTHAWGARITDSPRFPRTRIKAEIQQVVDTLYPTLFAVALDETNKSRPQLVTYPMPAEAEGVISVTVESIGPTKQWLPLTKTRFDDRADTNRFPTGKSLDIYKPMPPGRTIKVLYRKRFGTFGNETDTLESVGLEEPVRAIIKFQASAHMLMAMDAGRLQTDTIESANRSALVQPLQAAQVAHQWLAFAQTLIQEELKRLNRLYRATQVWVG